MQRSNSTSSQSRQSAQSAQSSESVRYPAAHASSSAFSASANPNEDWTKISDLAERRRIQNRIAQRNYRKKLKRRLEDLERKAGSTSTSPETSHAELVLSAAENQQALSTSSSMTRQPSRTSIASSTISQDQQLSPEIEPLDDPFANTTMQERSFQYLSPPTYAYSSYSPAGSDYFSQDSFSSIRPVPQIYTECHLPLGYENSLASTLPIMATQGMMKPDPYSMDDDEYLNPFGMNYATLESMDVSSYQTPVGYMSRQSQPQSVSSDGWTPNVSRESSPPFFAQPSTPISRSTSPNVHLFDQNWQL